LAREKEKVSPPVKMDIKSDKRALSSEIWPGVSGPRSKKWSCFFSASVNAPVIRQGNSESYYVIV
jgi:hypothetical protein